MTRWHTLRTPLALLAMTALLGLGCEPETAPLPAPEQTPAPAPAPAPGSTAPGSDTSVDQPATEGDNLPSVEMGDVEWETPAQTPAQTASPASEPAAPTSETGSAAPASEAASAPAPGNQGDQASSAALAPAFALTDTRGQTHRLEDYRGKFVVLEWINHGCPFVQKHYGSGNMQALQAKYAEQGVVWFSIASSAPGEQGHYSAEGWNQVNQEKGSKAAAVLMDENGQVGRLYGAKTTPHMYVIDPQGRLIYEGGLDNKATTNRADLASATNYVAQTLDAALAGQPVPVSHSRPYGCSIKYMEEPSK